MTDNPLRLAVLPDRLAVCRLDPREGVPSWATEAPFFSVSRTADELSVVCPEGDVPADVKHEAGWRALKVEGPLDFGETGLLLALAAPLADTGVSIFAISTFDTDYVLVKGEKLDAALCALRDGGLEVRDGAGAGVVLRPATADDERFLWEMLAEAAQETSVEAVVENPGTARYVEGWGRNGDLGLVAESGGEPLGAAWARLLRGDGAGYGYVDDETPELAIGLRPEARGKGVGQRLLSRLVEEARSRYSAVSLSVRAGNSAALRLYERVGFEPVPSSERTNNVGGISFTMKLNFMGKDSTDSTARGSSFTVRPATGDDEPFLWEMLYESVHWGPEESGPKPPLEELLSDPVLTRFVAGWGRVGDLGVVALDVGGRPIGAAWSRLFTESKPVYGFVGAATPAIAIAVAPEARGKGAGGVLLDALMDAARSEGFERISLSVQRSNPVAARLYEKRGFFRLREEGDAWVMQADLGVGGQVGAVTRGDR